MTRTKKIQARYKVTGPSGYRKTKVLPSLNLTGDWFAAAGFTPGNLANIIVQEGVITIRTA